MLHGVQETSPVIQTIPEAGRPVSNSSNPSFTRSSIENKGTPKEGVFRRLINWILSVFCFCCRKKTQAPPQIAQTPPRELSQPVKEKQSTPPPIKRDFKISSIDDLYLAYKKAESAVSGDESYLEPMLQFIQSNDLDLSHDSKEILSGITYRYYRSGWKSLFDAFISRPRQKELLNDALLMALFCIERDKQYIGVAERLIAAGADDTLKYNEQRTIAEKMKFWKRFFQT